MAGSRLWEVCGAQAEHAVLRGVDVAWLSADTGPTARTSGTQDGGVCRRRAWRPGTLHGEFTG